MTKAAPPSVPAQAALAAPSPAAAPAPDLWHSVSLNLYLDGYYEYNFNSPIGRVNELRAYDVSSNLF